MTTLYPELMQKVANSIEKEAGLPRAVMKGGGGALGKLLRTEHAAGRTASKELAIRKGMTTAQRIARSKATGIASPVFGARRVHSSKGLLEKLQGRVRRQHQARNLASGRPLWTGRQFNQPNPSPVLS